MSVSTDVVLESLAGYQITTYVHVSSAALLISDWFFTLDVEIAHAWGAPWNMGTILFFLTRYLVFVDTFISLYRQLGYSIPISMCAILYTTGGWLVGFGIFIAELILTIRVWALWERRRDIKIFLIIISIVNASAGYVGYGFYGLSFKFVDMDRFSPTIPGCFSNSGGKTLQWTFLALLVHQMLIFMMTVIKGIQHYQEGAYNTSLTYTFYRDGLSYYAVLIILSAINLAVLFSQPTMAYANLVTSIQRVLHSILSARMLLHLRQEADTLCSTGQDFDSLATLYYNGDLSIESRSPSDLTLIPGIFPKIAPHDNSHKSGIAGNWFGRDKYSSHRRRIDSEV